MEGSGSYILITQCRNPDVITPTTYSFSQCVAQRLHDAGIPQSLISGLMQAIRADPGLSDMAGLWNNSVDGYPDGFQLTVWFAVHKAVTAWLTQHKTADWYSKVKLPSNLDS
jgi:hypothetical protein